MLSVLIASSLLTAPPSELDVEKFTGERPKVTAEIRADRDGVQPGQTFNLLVELQVPETTYVYTDQKNANGIGLQTKVSATAPKGFDVGSAKFPEGTVKQTSEGPVLAYLKDTTIVVPVTAPADLEVGKSFDVKASCRYQYCDKVQCYSPKTKSVTLTLPVVAAGTAVKVVEPSPVVASETETTVAPSRPKEWPADLWVQLGFGFLAGLFLNVMPCVLPVIAIKVLSFVQHAGESRRKLFAANMTYSLGVLSVFWILAAMAIFAGLNWGQQFQARWFTMLMAWGVFVLSLSLLGVFEIPLPGFVGSIGSHRQEGPAGVFLSGAASTILATPCTGPFLGPLLAWSFSQPAEVSFLTWTSVGLGMASPYILFAFVPGAVKLLPKPGEWMVTFKQISGFVMLATAVFLLNSFKEKEAIIRGLFLFVATGFYFWLTGSRINVLTPARQAWATRGLAIVGVAAFMAVPEILFPKKLLPWTPFSEARMLELVKEGKPILIDFTADWCLTCRVNERVAIERPAVLAAVKRLGVEPLYADWTDESKEIEKWIEKFGSDGIPLTVVIPPGDLDKTISLAGPFTEKMLLDAIEQSTAPAKPEAPKVAAQR